MDVEPRGSQWVARSPGPLELALLFVFALWLLVEAVRVVTGNALAQPASRAEPAASALNAPASARCGMVKRAARTWVEFGPGLGPDDMVRSAHAAAAAVRTVDAAFCAAFVRDEPVPWLAAQRAQLRGALKRGGFEVSRVLLSGPSLTQAQLWMNPKGESESEPEWSIALSREAEDWQVLSLARIPLR